HLRHPVAVRGPVPERARIGCAGRLLHPVQEAFPQLATRFDDPALFLVHCGIVRSHPSKGCYVCPMPPASETASLSRAVLTALPESSRASTLPPTGCVRQY